MKLGIVGLSISLMLLGNVYAKDGKKEANKIFYTLQGTFEMTDKEWLDSFDRQKVIYKKAGILLLLQNGIVREFWYNTKKEDDAVYAGTPPYYYLPNIEEVRITQIFPKEAYAKIHRKEWKKFQKALKKQNLKREKMKPKPKIKKDYSSLCGKYKNRLSSSEEFAK